MQLYTQNKCIQFLLAGISVIIPLPRKSRLGSSQLPVLDICNLQAWFQILTLPQSWVPFSSAVVLHLENGMIAI